MTIENQNALGEETALVSGRNRSHARFFMQNITFQRTNLALSNIFSLGSVVAMVLLAYKIATLMNKPEESRHLSDFQQIEYTVIAGSIMGILNTMSSTVTYKKHDLSEKSHLKDIVMMGSIISWIFAFAIVFFAVIIGHVKREDPYYTTWGEFSPSYKLDSQWNSLRDTIDLEPQRRRVIEDIMLILATFILTTPPIILTLLNDFSIGKRKMIVDQPNQHLQDETTGLRV